jgi:hypothetical protein
MAGQARSSRFVTRASRDKSSSGSTEKEAVIQDGSLEGPLHGQDENEEKQTTADDPDAIHIPKWLRTNTKTFKAEETSTEWRDACKEYESFSRELKIPKIPKFPQLRLKNTERKLILRTLGRAESRGEVPYESELDDAEREEVYEDVRQDLKNIRESVKQAKRLLGGRNGDRTLFELIDWQEDQFELSSGMFWGHESDEDDEEEESEEEDAANEENISKEQLSSKEAKALAAGSEPAEQAEVDEEMGAADDNEQEEKFVEGNGEEKEEKSEEQPSSKETEAPVADSELAKQVAEGDEGKEGETSEKERSSKETEALVVGNELAKQVEVDKEMGEADDDKPDGSSYVAGNVNSEVQGQDGHELAADEGAATVNSLVRKEDGHESVENEEATTAGNVNSLKQEQDGHAFVAGEDVATTAS